MESFTRLLSESSPPKDSMFSERESLSNTSNISSVASSYKYPSTRGLFRTDYEPFSLESVQQKHKALIQATKDFGCDEKRNDSRALITALKNLQEKVRGLEVEKALAADHLKTIKDNVNHELKKSSSKSVTEKSVQSSPFVSREQSMHVPLSASRHSSNKDQLKAQLNNRERELQYMRELLHKSENEKLHLQSQKQDIERQQELLLSQQAEAERAELFHPPQVHPIVRPKMRPLRSEEDPQSEEGPWSHNQMSALKHDYDSLNRKVKELEGKLETQQPQQQDLARGYSEMRSEAGRLLTQSGDNHRSQVRAAHKRTKSCRMAAATTVRPQPGVHYRLNARDVPFILGTSTKESYSVVANMQKAVSHMKVHSHALCGAVASSALQRDAEQRLRQQGATVIHTGSHQDLQTLLADLERELSDLACEHYRVQQASGQPVSIQQLDEIADRMKSKEEHIRIVKGQLSALKNAGKKKKKPAVRGTRPLNPGTATSNPRDLLGLMANYEQLDVEDLEQASPHQRNLHLLRNAKSLQSTLQKDDLWWD